MRPRAHPPSLALTCSSRTVGRFLGDLRSRYGGVDVVMLWHSYPNIGVDDRNQFEMLADLPGGMAGLAQLVSAFHARHVRVLLCYNPWDTGTHDAYSTHSPYERVVGAVRAAGADGFNGDQMYGVPAGFQEVATADGGAPIVLEPESELAAKQSVESLLLLIAAVPAVCFNNSATGVATDAMTWSGAYAFDSQPAPLTLSFKALEHRHIVHVLQRDGRDRTRAVQTSWFNGAGIHSWENVFGIWNGLTPRVAAATAAVATLLRGLGPLVQGRKTRSLFSI